MDIAYNEMHVIAYVYHWNRDTLFALSSRERRKWVEIIMKQKDAEQESLSKK